MVTRIQSTYCYSLPLMGHTRIVK
eukprot:COSAG02_NODE_32889_length_509_cov_0.404878_3_plen_23_part_01